MMYINDAYSASGKSFFKKKKKKLTHINHIGTQLCILYEHKKISRESDLNALLAKNRLHDRLQRLQTSYVIGCAKIKP